jgi:hypothetical protein
MTAHRRSLLSERRSTEVAACNKPETPRHISSDGQWKLKSFPRLESFFQRRRWAIKKGDLGNCPTSRTLQIHGLDERDCAVIRVKCERPSDFRETPSIEQFLQSLTENEKKDVRRVASRAPEIRSSLRHSSAIRAIAMIAIDFLRSTFTKCHHHASNISQVDLWNSTLFDSQSLYLDLNSSKYLSCKTELFTDRVYLQADLTAIDSLPVASPDADLTNEPDIKKSSNCSLKS